MIEGEEWKMANEVSNAGLFKLFALILIVFTIVAVVILAWDRAIRRAMPSSYQQSETRK